MLRIHGKIADNIFGIFRNPIHVGILQTLDVNRGKIVHFIITMKNFAIWTGLKHFFDTFIIPLLTLGGIQICDYLKFLNVVESEIRGRLVYWIPFDGARKVSLGVLFFLGVDGEILWWNRLGTYVFTRIIGNSCADYRYNERLLNYDILVQIFGLSLWRNGRFVLGVQLVDLDCILIVIVDLGRPFRCYFISVVETAFEFRQDLWRPIESMNIGVRSFDFLQTLLLPLIHIRNLTGQSGHGSFGEEFLAGVPKLLIFQLYYSGIKVAWVLFYEYRRIGFQLVVIITVLHQFGDCCLLSGVIVVLTLWTLRNTSHSVRINMRVILDKI